MDTAAALQSRMHELRDLQGVIGLMTWDQETYMPPGAETARGAQLATVQGLYHERLVDPRLGDWLAWAQGQGGALREQARPLVRERDRAVKVPSRLVKELAEAQAHALGLWKRAREAKDFSAFQPGLERLLALRREQADAIGHGGQRYDALLEGFEPGMTVQRLAPVLDSLRAQLVPLVQALDAQPRPPDVVKGKRFPEAGQWAFTLELLAAMGFDMQRGRQDKSVHPFTGGTHPTDVRLTTRLSDDNPLPAIFGTIHEGGHGLYEQGYHPDHHRTPLAQSPSMGLHESQSRLWENVVGRSTGFWAHFLPKLQRHFPSELGTVSLDAWVRHVNRVERSLIRVEADEVTYNLHIVLRFQLEVAMLGGDLQVKDLPGAWNEKMKALLGLTPGDVKEGVLQDIHWAWGELGYFPTYSLGNLYSASLYNAAKAQVPGLEASIREGRLAPLLEWLRAKVHHQGYRLDAEDVVRQATGRGLTDADFVAYLKAKYGALYGVAL